MRFQRARNQLPQQIFAPVIHFPSVFLSPDSVCKGTEGHRHAMRNAWSLASTMNFTCIFEDDILRNKLPLPDIRKYKYDLIFLGNLETLNNRYKSNDYYTNHAQCMTRKGAQQLLSLTRDCLTKKGRGVDELIRNACKSKHIKCIDTIHAYTQDRLHVKSYLHDSKNNYIGT